jgi:exopolysaccharide biosynthesis protein
VTTSDIKQLVRTFYYDSTTAYSQNTAAGIAWSNAHDSAIYDQTNAAYKANQAADITGKMIDSEVPDLTTISADPTWKLGASACNPAMTTPPAGRTFIVTIVDSLAEDGYVPYSGKEDVHVTLQDGKLVDYLAWCVGN